DAPGRPGVPGVRDSRPRAGDDEPRGDAAAVRRAARYRPRFDQRLGAENFARTSCDHSPGPFANAHRPGAAGPRTGCVSGGPHSSTFAGGEVGIRKPAYGIGEYG